MAATWALGASKTYDDGTATLIFSAFETLQGGAGDDTFDLQADTEITLLGGGSNDTLLFSTDGTFLGGSFDGEAGTDSLDYSGFASSIAVHLAAQTGTGLKGFSNLENLVGGCRPHARRGKPGQCLVRDQFKRRCRELRVEHL